MRDRPASFAKEAVISAPPVLPAVPEAPRDLEILYRISIAVHRAVRDSQSSPHRGDVVAMGADGTPTEELDRLAEAEILRVLDAEGVRWDLLSEEIGRVARGGDRTLVVDPIDGSHNALRGQPIFTVSLALGSSDLAGIDSALVRDLHHGTTWWASRGGGAFRDGRPIRTRRWDARTEMMMVNLGRHATERASRLATKARRVRALGCASQEIVLVSQGSADGYFFENAPDTRNLRATDIAAAYRILLEAGGGMTDSAAQSLETFPLGLDRRTSVLAWGDAAFRSGALGSYL
jgi:fructose-1,6-bisphosphatase/inositol monophosphatase family enzyme